MSLLKNEKLTEEKKGKEKIADDVEQELIEDFDKEIARQDQKSGIVKISPLNVRDNPSFNGAIIGALNEGDAAFIVDEKDGWGQLLTGGWVYLDYVSR